MSSVAVKSVLLIVLFVAGGVLSVFGATRTANAQALERAAKAAGVQAVADLGGEVAPDKAGGGQEDAPSSMGDTPPVSIVDEILEPFDWEGMHFTARSVPPSLHGAQAPCTRLDSELRPPIA